jgi:hypothetical protein
MPHFPRNQSRKIGSSPTQKAPTAIDVLSRKGCPSIVVADQVWIDRVVDFQVKDGASSVEVLNPQGIAVNIPLADKTSHNSSDATHVYYAALSADDEIVSSVSARINSRRIGGYEIDQKTIAKHAQEIVRGDFGLDLVDLAKAGWRQ